MAAILRIPLDSSIDRDGLFIAAIGGMADMGWGRADQRQHYYQVSNLRYQDLLLKSDDTELSDLSSLANRRASLVRPWMLVHFTGSYAERHRNGQRYL